MGAREKRVASAVLGITIAGGALGSLWLDGSTARAPRATSSSSVASSTPRPAGRAVPASTRGPQHVVSAWRAVAVGSVFETETVTQLASKAAAPVVMTKQTVVAKDDEGVTLRIETLAPGVESTPQEVRVSFTMLEAPAKKPSEHCPEMPAAPAPRTTNVAETCQVPAGKFDCVKTIIEYRQGAVALGATETWMARDIPIAIKSVTTNENMASTTKLVRFVPGRS
jgi:hypothetical protein